MASLNRLSDWSCTSFKQPASSSSTTSSLSKCAQNEGNDDVSKDTKNCYQQPPDKQFIDKEQIINQFPTAVSFIASNLVYLVTLLGLRTLHHKQTKGKVHHHRRRLGDDVLYGLLSAIVSVIVTTPLWVIRSRLNESKFKAKKDEQSDKSTKQILEEVNMLKELINISQDKGVKGLWEGVNSSLLIASINSPVQTVVYESLRRTFARRCGSCAGGGKSDGNLLHLAALISMMIISRCTATTLTYPLSRAQKSNEEEVECKSNSGGDENGKPPQSLLTALQSIITTEGAGGLFKGMQEKLLQTSILTGVLAFTHPRIILYILKMYRSRKQKLS